jgi:hypothetical protein
VLPTGQSPEHLFRLAVVPRLAEDGAVEQHERVGSEDPVVRMPEAGGGGLRARESRRRGGTRLARQNRFVDLGGTDSKRNSERRENLRAARGGRGKNETEIGYG